jgi:hypothetical protein
MMHSFLVLTSQSESRQRKTQKRGRIHDGKDKLCPSGSQSLADTKPDATVGSGDDSKPSGLIENVKSFVRD